MVVVSARSLNKAATSPTVDLILQPFAFGRGTHCQRSYSNTVTVTFGTDIPGVQTLNPLIITPVEFDCWFLNYDIQKKGKTYLAGIQATHHRVGYWFGSWTIKFIVVLMPIYKPSFYHISNST